MEFSLANTFMSALGKLPAADARAVKEAIFDMQTTGDLSGNGRSFHRIEESKDRNFWSARVGLDLRVVIHKVGEKVLFAFVGHHDPAYEWAKRRRIEEHPRTKALQIVEVRELVAEISPPVPVQSLDQPAIFESLSEDDLLSIGTPSDWVDDVRLATEDGFFAIADHLPGEVTDALLEYLSSGQLPSIATPREDAPHPDTLRRIHAVKDADDLKRALEAPWEQWSVFLHPLQKETVEKTFSGPARVSGSAGTGKTIVALHRVARIAQEDESSRILFATFSRPLAEMIQRKLPILVGAKTVSGSVRVADWGTIALELFELHMGYRPVLADAEVIKHILAAAVNETGEKSFSSAFLLAEWTQVIDMFGIEDEASYLNIARSGLGARLGSSQRTKLWPIFSCAKSTLASRRLWTQPSVNRVVTRALSKEMKPFTHVVVDEAQDLSPSELQLLAALPSSQVNPIFFAGDSGQRIFQVPFSWKSVGVDIRGRSSNLKICYRTSRQIREAADLLLPSKLTDMDGNEEIRKGTRSLFDGPVPDIQVFESKDDERDAVAEFIRNCMRNGAQVGDFGIFVRSPWLQGRAKAAVTAAGLATSTIEVAPMNLAKGLEFKIVVVMACDQEVLPLEERVLSAADDRERRYVYDTERQLLYVACTRARDSLMITGVKPGSEFLKDLNVAPHRNL